MAILLVTGQHASLSRGTAGATISVSFPAPTTAGNLILVLAMCNSAQSALAPTDDKGNSYAASAPETTSVAGGQKVSGWYARSGIGGVVSVTANFSASTSFCAIAISEYSGVDPLAPLDQVGGLYTPSTADALSPVVTPLRSDELIWGGCVNNIGVSNTAGTNFTLLDTDAASGHAHEYFVQGVGAAIAAEFKAASAGAWAVLVATFRPATLLQSGQWAAGYQAVGNLDQVASAQPPDSSGSRVRTLETFPVLPSTTPAVGGQGVVTPVETQVFVVSDGT